MCLVKVITHEGVACSSSDEKRRSFPHESWLTLLSVVSGRSGLPRLGYSRATAAGDKKAGELLGVVDRRGSRGVTCLQSRTGSLDGDTHVFTYRIELCVMVAF